MRVSRGAAPTPLPPTTAPGGTTMWEGKAAPGRVQRRVRVAGRDDIAERRVPLGGPGAEEVEEEAEEEALTAEEEEPLPSTSAAPLLPSREGAA